MMAIHCFTVSTWLFCFQHFFGLSKKGKGAKELEQLMKHLSTKIQEVTPNVMITKKNTVKYTSDSYLFSDKFAPDIEGFTDKPIWCSIWSWSTFVDDNSK